MNEIEIAVVRLTWAEQDPGPPSPHFLRGAIADRFREDSLFHQHSEDGLVYRYPRIQYRWDRDGASVFGFGEGIRSLLELPWPGLSLRIGTRFLTVLNAEYSFRRHVVQQSDRLIRYRISSPWIPFNQINFNRYQSMTPTEQATERDRLAIAGLLVALRGLNVNIDFRLYAAFEFSSSHRCEYKGVPLTGFHGILLANLTLPEGIAIGRAVSHGYGCLKLETKTPHPTLPSSDRS